MTHNDDIKEIRVIVEKIQVDLAIVKTNLTNHLKHHSSSEKWLQWGLPLAISIILLIKELI